MEKIELEKTLQGMGIKTTLLNSKRVFNRREAITIFNCTYPTLKRFEKRNWIKPHRYKNRNFYTRDSILNCINLQTQTPLEAKTHSD